LFLQIVVPVKIVVDHTELDTLAAGNISDIVVGERKELALVVQELVRVV
jgi:hypothetical protein